MSKQQSCRTCISWDKPAKVRAMADSLFPCVAPLPVLALPDSVTRHYSFGAFARAFMGRDDGKRCPCWTDTVPAAPVSS